MIVDVLSPNFICSLDRVNLTGTRMWLSGGAFSESEMSGDNALCGGSSSCGGGTMWWLFILVLDI